jgi:uncharacterized membrane protein
MMLIFLLLSLPFLMGCVCGLRSMTAPAVVCWAVHLGWLQLDGTKLAFLHSPVSLAVFTLLAIGELVADKLPFIPSRIMAGPLVVRILFGALCGLALMLSGGAAGLALPGAAAGGVGAVVGAFAGYQLRRWLTVRRGLPDLPIALLEDVAAIGFGFYVASGGFLKGLVIFSGFL